MGKKVYSKPQINNMGKLISKTLGGGSSKNEPHVAENRNKW